MEKKNEMGQEVANILLRGGIQPGSQGPDPEAHERAGGLHWEARKQTRTG